MIRKYAFLLLASAVVSGCAVNKKESILPAKSERWQMQPSPLKSEKTDETKRENVDSEEDKGPTSSELTTTEIGSIGGLSRVSAQGAAIPNFDDIQVSYVADDLPLEEYVSQVYGDLLGLNYVLAPEVRAADTKVSLSLSEPISKEELYRVASNTLEQQNYTLLTKDNILYIQPADAQQQKNNVAIGIGRMLSDIPDSFGEITQIVPYVYTGSRNVSNIMSKLSSAKLTILSQQKLIIVEGDRNEVERALKLINMLDVPRAFGKQIRLIAPADAAEQIELLLAEDGLVKNTQGDFSLIEMPRINALVAYAVSDEVMDRILYWGAQLDVPLAGDEPQFYVFRPKFSKAEDLMNSVSALLGNIRSDRRPSESSSNNQNSQSESRSAPRSQPQSFGSGSSIQMSYDETQNALLFNATPGEYRQVLSLLEQLDNLPGQVILDVAIVEVTLKDDANYGIDWSYASNGAPGTRPTSGGSSSTSSGEGLAVNLFPGAISATGIDGNWRAALSIVEDQGDTRVLSKPYIVVQDGESASINSGDSIPTISAVVTDISNPESVTSQVQYRTTGIQASLTPTINSDGVVSLEVSLSQSRSDASRNIGVETPTITNRSLTTSIITQDGQTVIIGGLIQETITDNQQRVPGLGDIPLLGKLFQSETDNYARTELIMMITTKIVKNADDLDDFGDKISELYSVPIIR